MRFGIVIGFARAALALVSVDLAVASCGFGDPAAPQGGDGAVGGSGGTSTGSSETSSGAAGSSNPGTGGGEMGGSGGDDSVGTIPDASSPNPGTKDANVIDSPIYVADRGANAQGILFHVKNNCPFELWMHGGGKEGVLEPDNAHLMTGDTQDYVAPDEWTAARLTAYGSAPNAKGEPQNEIDKVEMTLTKKVINYNITYVDWVALPVEMVAIGTGQDCKKTGCYAPEAAVLTGCPDGLLSGKRCLSAGSYCSDGANKPKPFCHALDAQIAKCGADAQKYPACAPAAAGTPEAYGCASGTFFGGSPKWCAALNRGMLDDPDNGNISLYYKNAPYNTYAQWVHATCPGIYAFAYDDYGKTNESGFHACTGGTQLNVTFCPGG